MRRNVSSCRPIMAPRHEVDQHEVRQTLSTTCSSARLGKRVVSVHTDVQVVDPVCRHQRELHFMLRKCNTFKASCNNLRSGCLQIEYGERLEGSDTLA